MLAKLVLSYDMELAPEFDGAKFISSIKNMRTTIFGEPLLIKATARR